MYEQKLPCREAEAMLKGFLNGELSPEDLRRLDGHLEQCWDCREELWALRVGHEVREVLTPEKGFEPTATDSLRRALAAIEERPPTSRRIKFVRRWWWVAASAAALLLATFLIRRVMGPVEQSQNTSVARRPEAHIQEEHIPSQAQLTDAEAPTEERRIREVRLVCDGVQIIWFFDSHFAL